ncbi:MAG: hypothetical protein AAF628_34120 [Planctomycetota bacterium]
MRGDAIGARAQGTWEWDGRDWQHFSSRGPLEYREGHNMVYDRAGRRVILFGGDLRQDLWTYAMPPTLARIGR